MPVMIGAKPESSFTGPIGLLIDCHRRIERFLAVLVQCAEQVRGGSLTPEQRASLENALRYFRDAAPNHTAHEEESLFPRLRQLAQVGPLEQDHGWAEISMRRSIGSGRLGWRPAVCPPRRQGTSHE